MKHGATTALGTPFIWLGVIVLTLLTLLVVELIWWLVLPLVLSIILYYVSLPFIQWLKKKRLHHGQALGVYLGVSTLVLLLLVPLGIKFIYGVVEIQDDADRFLHESLPRVLQTLERNFSWLHEVHLSEKSLRKLEELRTSFSEEYLSGLAVYVLSWIPSLLLVPYLAFFFLKDAPRFKRFVMRGVPNAFFEKTLLLLHRIDVQMKKYFQGLLALTFLDAVTLGAGLWLIGMPYPIFGFWQSAGFGVLCGVLAWVPYIGTAMGWGVISLACLAYDPANIFLVGLATALFVVVRLLDDFFYTPLTIGRSLQVHPLVTVVIIFSGGVIAGVPGLLLAMPVLGVCMVLGEIVGEVWMDKRLQARYRHAKHLELTQARQNLSVS